MPIPKPTPKFNSQLEFECWEWVGAWSLELGAWDLTLYFTYQCPAIERLTGFSKSMNGDG